MVTIIARGNYAGLIGSFVMTGLGPVSDSAHGDVGFAAHFKHAKTVSQSKVSLGTQVPLFRETAI